jgi:L-asparaginase
MDRKVRIAHLAGPNATIQNTPPLVTSNKARAKYGLAPRLTHQGTEARFDVLRPQRLAAPAKLYVEAFSAHPLEADMAELYGPPDGFLDEAGVFHAERQSATDRPVYEVEVAPEDGLYPLPYMARQADGSAWEDDVAAPFAPESRARQPFLPDGSRSFEEIDRLGVGDEGVGNQIGGKADVDFYRILPPSGYTKGLAAELRTDTPLPGADGDISPERRGREFFPYKPVHIEASPPRSALAKATNDIQRILSSGKYDGAIWTQGSPRIEESIYWFNLLLDVKVPLCGNAAQRMHGAISNDGPRNLIDSVDYIASGCWQDEEGRNRAGMVLVQEQRVFAAREVMKGDARPGGYLASGGHGGILGASGHEAGPPMLLHVPATRHTWKSEVNISRLPSEVVGVRMTEAGIVPVSVAVKDRNGDLLGSAIPPVRIIKDGSYGADDWDDDPAREVDLIALIDDNLRHAPLAGFVVEGLSPYGRVQSKARRVHVMRAIYSGMPVVGCGRGNTEGFAFGKGGFIGGSNLTSTKARLLLMACLLRFGAYPPAKDPSAPTPQEKAATEAVIAKYQKVFDTH